MSNYGGAGMPVKFHNFYRVLLILWLIFGTVDLVVDIVINILQVLTLQLGAAVSMALEILCFGIVFYHRLRFVRRSRVWAAEAYDSLVISVYLAAAYPFICSLINFSFFAFSAGTQIGALLIRLIVAYLIHSYYMKRRHLFKGQGGRGGFSGSQGYDPYGGYSGSGSQGYNPYGSSGFDSYGSSQGGDPFGSSQGYDPFGGSDPYAGSKDKYGF